jgi:hypothetical protein
VDNDVDYTSSGWIILTAGLLSLNLRQFTAETAKTAKSDFETTVENSAVLAVSAVNAEELPESNMSNRWGVIITCFYAGQSGRLLILPLIRIANREPK